jgi:hypothetical protein
MTHAGKLQADQWVPTMALFSRLQDGRLVRDGFNLQEVGGGLTSASRAGLSGVIMRQRHDQRWQPFLVAVELAHVE